MLQAIENHASSTSSMPTSEEAFVQQEQRKKITEVMRKLAETLDISISQVKVTLHRSRDKFRELADEWERGYGYE